MVRISCITCPHDLSPTSSGLRPSSLGIRIRKNTQAHDTTTTCTWPYWHCPYTTYNSLFMPEILAAVLVQNTMYHVVDRA